MPTAKVNSVEIYYEETGSGPPIILSAGGLQGTLAGYGPVIGELSREHQVISYDRRFGGQSNSPLVVQTWDMVCQDVMDLMDALCIERAYLGGGSFGSAIGVGRKLGEQPVLHRDQRERTTGKGHAPFRIVDCQVAQHVGL